MGCWEWGWDVACRTPTGPDQGWLGCVERNDKHKCFSWHYMIYTVCTNLYTDIFI